MNFIIKEWRALDPQDKPVMVACAFCAVLLIVVLSVWG